MDEPIEENSEDKPKPATEEKDTVTDKKDPKSKEASRLDRLKAWLKTRKGKVTAGIVGVLVVILAVILGTSLRYPVLGVFWHQRADISVVDDTTGQPIPGATVSLAGSSAQTDLHGQVQLSGLRLGRASLTVEKKAYQTYSVSVLVGLGKPHFEPVKLKSTGIAVTLSVTDKISGQPLDDVAAQVGDATSVSKAGTILLSLLPENGSQATIKLTKDGFVDATVTVPVKADTKPTAVALVPAGSVYYLSNKTGHLDLYAANLDGSAAKVALAATGNEDADTGILPDVANPDILAVVSTRDGRRDSGGTLIHDLFIFNTKSAQLNKIDEAIAFANYRAWLGDYLIYQKFDSSGGCFIKAYQVSTAKTATLVSPASGSCPTIVASDHQNVFYSISNTSQNNNGFFAIQANGAGQRRLSSTPSNRTIQPSRQTLLSEYYDYGQQYPEMWQSLNLGNLAVSKLDNGPSIETSRTYVDSPDGRFSAFIDERDGRSELYLTGADGSNEQKLTNFGSVNQFVQWYGGSYIVFSSTKTDENALYVVAASGGQPLKITDFYRGNQRTYGGGYNPVY